MWEFLVDEDLPRSMAVVLRQAGQAAADVRDVGLRGHSDAQVFAHAQMRGAVLVTADKGFANVLSFPPGTHARLIVMRVPNELPPQQVNQVLLRRSRAWHAKTCAGCSSSSKLGEPASAALRRPGDRGSRGRPPLCHRGGRQLTEAGACRLNCPHD